jgi:hypothetical protein
MINFFDRAGYILMPWKPYSAFRLVSIKIRTVTSRAWGWGGDGGGGGGDGGVSSDKYFFKLLKSLWEEGRKIPPRHAGRTGSKRAWRQGLTRAGGRGLTCAEGRADKRGRQG